MRTILFRVWEKPQGDFKGKMWTDNDPKFWASCLMNEKDEYELLQYTGLKDKNGLLIYEGDIIGENGKGFEVVFVDGHFSIRDELSKEIGDCPLIFRGKNYEVIGNIYESKHLLDNTDTKE